MNEDELDVIFDEAHSLAVKKNKDYGDKNILRFGSEGVVIRLSDKIERLINLEINQEETQVDDETIEDTCLDIINYAAYIIMLKRKTFKEE